MNPVKLDKKYISLFYRTIMMVISLNLQLKMVAMFFCMISDWGLPGHLWELNEPRSGEEDNSHIY